MATQPFSALRKQFASLDPSAQLEGIAAVRAIADTEVLAALLEGVAFSPGHEAASEGPTLRGGAVFTGKNPSEQLRLDRALWAVLAELSVRFEPARALVEQVTSLVVASGTTSAEFDLTGIEVFSRLATIELRGLRPLMGTGALARLPALKSVKLARCGLGDGLAPLATSASIESVHVEGELHALGELGAFSSLRELSVKTQGTLRGLAGLGRLAGIERVTIEGASDVHDLSDLSALSSLRELALRRIVGLRSLDGIDRCVGLRSLTINQSGGFTSIAPLAPLVALETLDLGQNYGGFDLAPIAGCTRLRRVSLFGCSMVSLDALAGKPIESLDITSCGVLPNLLGLRGNTVLRELNAANLGCLTSLAGIEGATEITELNLGWCGALKDVRALRGFTRLQALRADNAVALTSLDGLEGCTALTRLFVRGARLVTSLAPLSGLPALSALYLENAVLLADIDAVGTLPSLEKIDLRGCLLVKDPTPLTRASGLSAAALKGTSIDPKSLPESLAKRVSWARTPDLDARVEHADQPHTRRDPLPKGTGSVVRKKISSLRKLLSARDFEQIDQGRELIVSLGDDALWEQYLGGVEWVTDEKTGFGDFVPNTFFDGTRAARVYRNHALFSLLANAPDTCATAARLRDAITDVQIEGQSAWKPVPVELGSLKGLPKLRRLELNYCKEPRHPETVAALSTLRELAVRSCSNELYAHFPPEGIEKLALVGVAVAAFNALAGHPTLQDLTLTAAPALNSISLARCAALKKLSFTVTRGFDGIDLTGCKSLDRIEASSQVAGPIKFVGAEDLAALRSVELTNTDAATARALLAHAPALERLELQGVTGLTDLGFLRAPQLKALKIVRCRSMVDLRALSALPNLESLTLDTSPELADVTPIASLTKLKTLSLRNSRFAGDLLQLDALKKLKRLDLGNTGRTPEELNERLRAIAVWR